MFMFNEFVRVESREGTFIFCTKIDNKPFLIMDTNEGDHVGNKECSSFLSYINIGQSELLAGEILYNTKNLIIYFFEA